MDPLFFGEYPSSMRTRVGDRLPKFSADEAALVKGSLDFVGINHYTTWYAKNNSTNIIGKLLHDTLADSGATTLRKFIIVLNAISIVKYHSHFYCCNSTVLGLCYISQVLRSSVQHVLRRAHFMPFN